MPRYKIIRSIISLAVAAPLLAAPIAAHAAPKHCPPGHAKKGWCKPGERYDLSNRRSDFRYIKDYDRYGLKRPREGYAYVTVDEELFLINRATQEVIEGLGALSYLLRQ